MTARWVVEEVRDERDLRITWQPISLFFKNSPEPDSPGYNRVFRTHKLLRVMEAVRAGAGDAAVETAYWEFASRIHHDDDRFFDPADALVVAGLDPAYGAALEDPAWDADIRRRMDEGLALAGDTIGTPIIGFDNANGQRVGYFGPVITRVPLGEQALALWDALITMSTVAEFWELKRTRTERADLGPRPS